MCSEKEKANDSMCPLKFLGGSEKDTPSYSRGVWDEVGTRHWLFNVEWGAGEVFCAESRTPHLVLSVTEGGLPFDRDSDLLLTAGHGLNA